MVSGFLFGGGYTQTGYPGQTNNPVGYAYAPSYPGNLTTWSGGNTLAPNTTYSFYDFSEDLTSGGVNIDCPTGVKFIGCRFQTHTSNSTASWSYRMAIGTAATGTITQSGQPANNDTVTVNGTVVTFVTGTASGNQVQIAGTAALTWAAFQTFLSGSADTNISKMWYALSSSTVITVTSILGGGRTGTTTDNNQIGTQGSIGNTYTLAKSSANITVSGANLTGGTDGATGVEFHYCSFTPLTSFVTAPPGAGGTGQNGLAWPSAGAGLNTITQTDSVNCTPGNDGYQFGFDCNSTSAGTVLFDHCDAWGFGNGFLNTESGTNGPITVNYCWIHDCCNAAPLTYHQDGLGYYDGLTGISNVTVQNSTIASIANSNGVAFQASTTAYNNISVTGCYLSGFGYLVALGVTPNQNTGTNMTFKNNILGTDVQSIYGFLYANYGTMFQVAGNNWSNNTINVVGGTTANGSFNPSWTGKNGYYLWPDQTFDATDWVP